MKTDIELNNMTDTNLPNYAPSSPYIATMDGSFSLVDSHTLPSNTIQTKGICQEELAQIKLEIKNLQRKLFSNQSHSVLIIFQGMDGSGKDTTIREVTNGLDPINCQVTTFHGPTKEDLSHNFLWRSYSKLPAVRTIAIFNRSYYEEVLIAKVHKDLLPRYFSKEERESDLFWAGRYQSIISHEQDLSRNKTIIIKFMLHISEKEQTRRLINRIGKIDLQATFNNDDLLSNRYWDQYLAAYNEAIRLTAKPWAPWYIIPAGGPPEYTQLCVSTIIRDTLIRTIRDSIHPQSQASNLSQVLSELTTKFSRLNETSGKHD